MKVTNTITLAIDIPIHTTQKNSSCKPQNTEANKDLLSILNENPYTINVVSLLLVGDGDDREAGGVVRVTRSSELFHQNGANAFTAVGSVLSHIVRTLVLDVRFVVT